MTAMGYEAPGTGQKLDFTGTAYEGLEVTVDSAPLSVLLDVMEHYGALTSESLDVPTAATVFRQLLEGFGLVLESWNVTKRGSEVPATLDGLKSLDSTFVLAIIGAWLTGTSAAGEELGKDSPDGGISPEAREAMAALSKSLPSS